MTEKQRNHKHQRDRERRAAKKKAAAAGTSSASSSNGTDTPSPAPKDGPAVTLRMRNGAQINRVKAAAKKLGISMNTFVVEVLDRATS
jgi:DNA invertase Pin-like site-specific DNA recombinase